MTYTEQAEALPETNKVFCIRCTINFHYPSITFSVNLWRMTQYIVVLEHFLTLGFCALLHVFITGHRCSTVRRGYMLRSVLTCISEALSARGTLITHACSVSYVFWTLTLRCKCLRAAPVLLLHIWSGAARMMSPLASSYKVE